MFNLAINPTLRLYIVMPTPFFLCCLFGFHFVMVLVRWLVALLHFLFGFVLLAKNANVLPKALAYSFFFSGNAKEAKIEIIKTPPTIPKEIGDEM